MTFVDVVSALGGVGMLTVVAGWLGSRLFMLRVDKDLEAHKAELQKEVVAYKASLETANAQELEAFKAQLQLTATERQSVLGHLHRQQFDVLARLYVLLGEVRTQASLTLRIQLQSAAEAEAAGFWAVHDTFTNYYREHRIFLPETLCEQLDEVLAEHLYMVNEVVLGTLPRDDRRRAPELPKSDWLNPQFSRL